MTILPCLNVAVGAGKATVAAVAEAVAGGAVVVAMDNCPHQCVAVGPTHLVAAVETALTEKGVIAERLPFKRPYHTPLFEQLLAAAKEHQAGLVITDTLTDIFSGNENYRGQARQFAQSALGRLARELGAASLTLAHPSLTGSANGSTGSGSTGWKGTFRSQLYLEPPSPEDGEAPDPDVRILRRAKANYARRDETIELR